MKKPTHSKQNFNFIDNEDRFFCLKRVVYLFDEIPELITFLEEVKKYSDYKEKEKWKETEWNTLFYYYYYLDVAKTVKK